MGLDDLLPILIVVGSIAVSIYRAINERNQKKPPPQNQSQPQTGLPRQERPSVPTTQPGQPTSNDLQKRLEEARRRVQQAMEEQSGRASPPRSPAPPPLVSGGLEGQSLEGTSLEGQTRERGLLTGQGSLESSGSLSGQRSQPKRQPLEPAFSESRRDVFRPIDAANRNPSEFQQMTTAQPFMGETAHRSERQITAALPQTRQRPRAPIGALKHAKIGGSELLSPEMLTEKELLRGFLWQQILSEPRSKVKLRTYPVQKARAEGKG